MDAAALDNPVWAALSGPHAGMAGRAHHLLWYPPAVAPFVAVPAADVRPDLDAAYASGLGSQAYFVGECPGSLPETWRAVSRSYILQLFPTGPVPGDCEDAGTVLGGADRSAMRALTQIAFPDFFRERTADLGEYLGVYADGALIAMAGERMALPGLQEISGVCTHPDFVGRGHARRLTLALRSRQHRRGVGCFLHVSEGNSAARKLYGSMGFEIRASLPMCKVERIGAGPPAPP